MHIAPIWLETVIPAGIIGMLTIGLMALGLAWWRSRRGGEDTRGIRARITETTPPSPFVFEPVLQPAVRSIQPKARSHLGQRNHLASSFVGRDRNAMPLE